MIQWLRPTRDTKVTEAIELSIEVISHLCSTALAINLLCGRCLSTSKSYWLFMSEKHCLHTAGILSHKWPTCTVSVTCFLPLFARCHRICFCLPCYIFITAGPCWYSALGRTKNTRTCAGSGKHDLTRVVEREDLPEVKALLFVRGEVPEGPWGHWVTSPGDISSRGQSAQDAHQQPGANAAAENRTQRRYSVQSDVRACRFSFLHWTRFHWLDPRLW